MHPTHMLHKCASVPTSLFISAAAAIFLTPDAARADLLLDTGTMISGATERDPGSIGFGEGVFVSTATDLGGFSLFLESPTGGHVKYLIFDGANMNLLLADSIALPPSSSPDWILSGPLSFSLDPGNTYYFGVIQDENTEIIAPFFGTPPVLLQNGLSTVATGNPNYVDFATPSLFSLAGGGFPLRLFGSQAPLESVPEPSMTWLAMPALLGAGYCARRRATRFRKS